MVVGVMQFELHVPWSESLKDKRRVVRSVKDRLHREHQVSVGEIEALESHTLAVLGLAIVGNDGARIGRVLDQISEKLRALTDAELGDTTREILHGSPITPSIPPRVETDDEARELVRMAADLGGDLE